MSSKLEKHSPETETRQSLEQSAVASQFASELKKPEQGSHFQKLKSIMGALILSGSIVFSPGTAKSMEMGVSQERMVYQRILDAQSTSEDDDEIIIKILQQLKEKGGIQEICGNERIFKSDKSADQVRKLAEDAVNEGKIPYYLKLENIFGSNFIKNNPEKAKEWFRKIEPVIKATVRIVMKAREGSKARKGSGVIIRTKKGLRILTSEHITNETENGAAEIELYGGGKAVGAVVAKDATKDLALLEIIQTLGSQKKMNKSLNDISPMEIEDSDASIGENNTLAVIGFPLGFPREVSLQKIISNMFKKKRNAYYSDSGNPFISLQTESDDRFRSLAYFEGERCGFKPRGLAIEGMSGGPVVNLDDKGSRPKLIGLVIEYHDRLHAYNVSVHSESIIEFLRSEGFHD